MNADRVLAILDAKRTSRSGRWLATCPSCKDLHSKLVIQVSGEIFTVECQTGCTSETVMADIEDLCGGISEPPHLIGWDKPLPLNEFPTSVFPVDALPSWLTEFVCAVSEQTQTPRDLCGCLALAALSTACAKKFTVQINACYMEPVNLYVVVVLPPGSRKSSVFAKMIKPIIDYEKELKEQLKPEITRAKTARDIKEKELQDAKLQAAKDPGNTSAFEISEQLANLEVPHWPQLITDDCTPERLAEILAEQSGRIAILSAEGGPFELMGGRYNQAGPNLDVYLKGHSGDSIRVDRVKRGNDSCIIDSPSLTCGLTVQPDVLQQLSDKPGFRGKGLLGRFLYSLPKNTLGNRKVVGIQTNPSTYDLYRVNLRKMLQLESMAEPECLPLSQPALDAWNYFSQMLEPRLGADGDLNEMTDWAGKLPGAIARIAGLLLVAECVDSNPRQSIQPQQMEAAIRLGEYFLSHAKVAYSQMQTDAATVGAIKIVNWLARSGAREFKNRDVWPATRGHFKRADKLRLSLNLLEEHGFIRATDQESKNGPGRKPAPLYQVNPKWDPLIP
jgi:replicative DNA helicase